MTLRPQLRVVLQSFFVLAFVSSCLSQSGKNPYNQELQSLVDRWQTLSDPAKAVQLDDIHRLREFVSDPSEITKRLTEIAQRNTESRLIRDEANWHSAQVAVQEARLDDARKFADGLGMIRTWILLKSKNCEHTTNFQGRTLKPGPSGTVLLHGPARAACVATTVYNANPRTVAIRFGADGPLKLLVNEAVLSSRSPKAFAFDQSSIGVDLPSGWTTLMLQLDSTTTEFALRVTGPKGGGISFSTVNPRAISKEVATAVVPDLLEVAKELPPSAESLETIAQIEKIRGMGYDKERLQSAADLDPSAERWLEVANVCADPQCVLTSLQRALQLDPKHWKAKQQLAEYYVRLNQWERARDVLREITTLEPDNFVAQKRLADLYATAGSTQLATSIYQQLEATSPMPIWLKRELAFWYQDQGSIGKANLLLSQVWKWIFDDERVRTALVGLAQGRSDEPALRMLAEAGEALDPMNPQLRFEAAQSDQSVLQQAAETEEERILRIPYAEMLSLVGSSTGKTARVLSADLGSNITRLSPGSPVAAGNDAAYLVDPVKLAEEARRKPPQENANVITLADVCVERVQRNGQSGFRVQQVFYMANERGARDYATRSIQYSSATQRLTLLGARLHKSDGTTVEAEDLGESSVADPSISMYYDTRSRSVRFPDLQKGDVISIEYRISPNSEVNPYGNYFGTLIAFQNGLPQQLRRYVLISPKGLALKVNEQRMPTRAVVGERANEVVRQWDIRNLQPLTIEPRGPALTEIGPYVSASTFVDWNQLGRWYVDLILPQFTLDRELRDALAKIDLVPKTELQKIHAIHEFVLRNTHYVAMEFGVYSYKPYPVSQVYARRFGDCKDKASLMVAMMRAAGIDAEFALVRTRKLGDVSEQATTLAVFNHAVAYVPKYDLWLDGTAEYAGSHELPLEDQGAMALTVNLNGNASLRRIPVTLPLQNYTHRVVRAEVQQDGKIQFSGSSYTRGEDAPGLRREYEIADRQRDTVRANLAQVYPGVQVDSVHVEGTHDLERDINVKFSGSLDKFSGSKDLALTSSWMPHKYVDSLSPQKTRTQDLLLPAPWTTEEELHFTVPERASINALPPDTHYDTEFGTAIIRYQHRGHELLVTTSVQFRKLRITPVDYPAFRDFCSQVEKLFRTEVKIRLAS